MGRNKNQKGVKDFESWTARIHRILWYKNLRSLRKIILSGEKITESADLTLHSTRNNEN